MAKGGKGRNSATRKAAVKAGYRSGMEYSTAQALVKVKFEYETEVISFVVPEKHRKYTPDFVLEKKKGGKMYLEVKGLLDFDTREKMKYVKECNPDLDIRFVFQNPYNRITKRSKTRYCDWADSEGFPWCGPTIPDEWLKEAKKSS